MVVVRKPRAFVFLSVNAFVTELFICQVQLVLAFFEPLVELQYVQGTMGRNAATGMLGMQMQTREITDLQ